MESSLDVLEQRLALRSLDEFLDLVDSLAVLPEHCSPNALLPLHRRKVALACRRLDFAALVGLYERLVAWLSGQPPPRAGPDPLALARQAGDHQAARAETARRAERACVAPAEAAVRLAEIMREMGAPEEERMRLLREAAALAAEGGDEALVKRATAAMRPKPEQEEKTVVAVPAAKTSEREETDRLIKALELRDEKALAHFLSADVWK